LRISKRNIKGRERMARPSKKTVDYFPHYVNTSEKKTLYILESKFGIVAYAFWFKLLEILGSSPGHYFHFDNPAEWQFLMAKTKVSDDIGRQILDELALLEAIDKDLYEGKCIWSNNFVDGLSEVYRRRQLPLPQKPSLNSQKPPHYGVIDGNNLPKAKVSTDENTQREEVEEVEGVEGVEKKTHKKGYGEFNNVLLTDNEYQKLIGQFGETGIRDRIENLSLYKKSKGKVYKDDYATILSWYRKDKKEAASGTDRRGPRSLPKAGEYTKPEDY